MQMRQAAALRVAWGNRPCIHPSTEREYDLGSHTGDQVCTQCGRAVTFDAKGNPIPST